MRAVVILKPQSKFSRRRNEARESAKNQLSPLPPSIAAPREQKEKTFFDEFFPSSTHTSISHHHARKWDSGGAGRRREKERRKLFFSSLSLQVPRVPITLLGRACSVLKIGGALCQASYFRKRYLVYALGAFLSSVPYLNKTLL